ncbi:helix-turn-helix transcriptional regulator [Lapillicoccus jejuensis]|uniref:Putative ArsR family transcriptional regulator n=1 Tax=Lapillicoccus jejuensis TaxID=402171 RepID=A0A542E447_9MICO|nr:putative ArsR family transcriptional regulator [Lapillicoccus jejuensis]
MFIGADLERTPEESARHLERRTRERVLADISEHAPVTAAQIGERLGLTPAAVRRHLDALAEQSVIEEQVPAGTASRGRGRPARAWVLSEAGHRALEHDYEDLAAQALRFLASHAGPDAVDAFARERVGELAARYAAAVAPYDDPQQRVGALVEAMTQDGYAASARPVGLPGTSRHGVQLCQGHCPVGGVAEEFPAICDAETEAISRLLGVHVQRLATLAGGAHVCTTFVPTPAPAGTPETTTAHTTDERSPR